MPERSSRLSARDWIVFIAILWIHLGLRLHNLLSFPPLVDEADHIAWARDLYDLHPFTGAANGRLFGLWWMALFGLDGDGALAVARAATVLFSLITVAVIFDLGRRLVTREAGILGAVIYSAAPYAFFYDRLALVDPYVTGWGALALWFAVRHARRPRDGDALAAGLALAGAIAAKATGIMLVPIPALAALLLTPGQIWRQRARGLAITYGALAAVWGPFYLLLRQRGYAYFDTATTVVGSNRLASILDRLPGNIEGLWLIDRVYFSLPVLLITLALVVYLLARRPRAGLFLLAALLIPLGGLLASATMLSARYFLFHLPALVLLMAAGSAAVFEDLRRRVRLPRTTILLLWEVWIIVFVAAFLRDYRRDPAALDLPPLDRLETITSDASGFALGETADYLLAEAGDSRVRVVGLLSNCRGLDLLIPAAHPVRVECPPITLDGTRQPEIAAQVNAWAAEGEHELWVALENLPFVSLEGITAPLEHVITFERPGGLAHIRLYRARG